MFRSLYFISVHGISVQTVAKAYRREKFSLSLDYCFPTALFSYIIVFVLNVCIIPVPQSDSRWQVRLITYTKFLALEILRKFVKLFSAINTYSLFFRCAAELVEFAIYFYYKV